MKLQLIQSDIEEAVKAYLSTFLKNLDNQDIEISFSSTRGAEGMIADITLTPHTKPKESPVGMQAPVTKPAPVEQMFNQASPATEAPKSDAPKSEPKKSSLFAGLNS